MNTKIAVILGVYNEENRIRNTLESIKMFDEIIVLDKSSSDATVKIAKEYGCRIYTVPYTDDTTDNEYASTLMRALDASTCDWIMLLTCSDILNYQLYSKMVEYISENDVDFVEVPFYRYSMGFISKYSWYGEYHFKDVLLKKCAYVNDANIHVMTAHRADSTTGRLALEDRNIAVYHLTHANLDMILERHLRYAAVEATQYETRDEGLKQSWHEILRQVYRYFKLKTYKLGEKGKAQLCMLLLYRSAKYLHVYFDEEEEERIKRTYEDIIQKNIR